jgi:hypothetical protein
MRQDQKFEIERAFDLIPHVIGASWAVAWFRFTGVRHPTREQYRERVARYVDLLEPLFGDFAGDGRLNDLHGYIRRRRDEEIGRIMEGRNKEVEKRYDRYVDYG